MKPGNLSERMMVPNPAATKDEDSILTHIESVGVRFFIFGYSLEKPLFAEHNNSFSKLTLWESNRIERT